MAPVICTPDKWCYQDLCPGLEVLKMALWTQVFRAEGETGPLWTWSKLAKSSLLLSSAWLTLAASEIDMHDSSQLPWLKIQCFLHHTGMWSPQTLTPAACITKRQMSLFKAKHPCLLWHGFRYKFHISQQQCWPFPAAQREALPQFIL